MPASSAQAAVLWSFEERSGGVFGEFSGSLDLAGAVYFSPGGGGGFGINPNGGIVSNTDALIDIYSVPEQSTFGTESLTLATTGFGSAFVLLPGKIAVPRGYVSGDTLLGSLSFAGATFASLGITPGDYVYSLPNDMVTLRFGPAAVIPLPASLPLLLGALGLALAAARRRG